MLLTNNNKKRTKVAPHIPGKIYFKCKNVMTTNNDIYNNKNSEFKKKRKC